MREKTFYEVSFIRFGRGEGKRVFDNEADAVRFYSKTSGILSKPVAVRVSPVETFKWRRMVRKTRYAAFE